MEFCCEEFVGKSTTGAKSEKIDELFYHSQLLKGICKYDLFVRGSVHCSNPVPN
jgi:hypothetical protein